MNRLVLPTHYKTLLPSDCQANKADKDTKQGQARILKVLAGHRKYTYNYYIHGLLQTVGFKKILYQFTCPYLIIQYLNVEARIVVLPRCSIPPLPA